MRSVCLTVSAVVFLGLLSGCAAFKGRVCDFQVTAIDRASLYVASELECANVEALKADITAAVSKLHSCEGVKPTGPIADIVAPIISKAVAGLIVDAPIPARYSCKATSLKNKVAEKLESFIRMIPVAEGA